MKLTKKKLYTAGIGTAAIGLLATAGITSAHFGGLMDEDTKNQLKTAVENKDYDAWKEIQDNKPEITDYVDNQEDFEKFIEMQEAYKSGETETGDALKSELGLPDTFKAGAKGSRGGQGGKQGQNKEAQTAIESGDYQAWLEATPEDSPIREVINSEENFQKLVKMHEAKESGDNETAKSIAEELNIRGNRGARPGGQGRGLQKSADDSTENDA